VPETQEEASQINILAIPPRPHSYSSRHHLLSFGVSLPFDGLSDSLVINSFPCVSACWSALFVVVVVSYGWCIVPQSSCYSCIAFLIVFPFVSFVSFRSSSIPILILQFVTCAVDGWCCMFCLVPPTAACPVLHWHYALKGDVEVWTRHPL